MVRPAVTYGILLVLLVCLSLGCASIGGLGSQPAELSVMSFNIRYGTANDGENRWENRREMVCDLIRQYDCDLESTDFRTGFEPAAGRQIQFFS